MMCELKMYTPAEGNLFSPFFSISFIFLSCSCTFEGRGMFLLGSGTGFPFMSVFDIRDMLWP